MLKPFVRVSSVGDVNDYRDISKVTLDFDDWNSSSVVVLNALNVCLSLLLDLLNYIVNLVQDDT